MWQQCPQCKGSGHSNRVVYSEGVCEVCKGFKIINEITGLPPNNQPLPQRYIGEGLEDYNLKSTYQSKDFRDHNMET